jgi:hypothetical protein
MAEKLGFTSTAYPVAARQKYLQSIDYDNVKSPLNTIFHLKSHPNSNIHLTPYFHSPPTYFPQVGHFGCFPNKITVSPTDGKAGFLFPFASSFPFPPPATFIIITHLNEKRKKRTET